MRLAIFVAIVTGGAFAGFVSAGNEDDATKLVLATIGSLVGAAIGGAVLKLGGAKAPKALEGVRNFVCEA